MSPPPTRLDTPVSVPLPPTPATATGIALPSGELESFLNEDVRLPALVRCGLAHYQFETIHPFLDGNGRLGRLLAVFYLVQQNLLPQPLLYLSSYFETHRSDYYDRLQAVREKGELQEWLQFFLTAVAVQATDAVERAERLADLREKYRRELASTRSRASEVVELLMANPFITVRNVQSDLGNYPARRTESSPRNRAARLVAAKWEPWVAVVAWCGWLPRYFR